jgi:hypothetical protein
MVTRACVWILCKTEALGSTCLSVVDETEVEYLAGAAENVCDLFLR